MKFPLTLPLVLALSSCTALPTLPPAEIPTASASAYPPAPSQQTWRPYSAGPLQNQFERKTHRRGTDWGRRTTPSSISKIDRAPLPSIEAAAVAPTQKFAEWSGYRSTTVRQPAPRSSRPSAVGTPSLFGQNVNSAWATNYVPPAFRTEFAIFARKAATGEARMVMPTGEVYSGSVTGRDGRCATVEVSVTADGDLPVISRGRVSVCG